MFKKVINVVRGSVSFAAGMGKKAKILCACAFGMLLASNASAQSALDGFISTNVDGDPVADPSKITTFIKSIVINTYSNWITVALIFVVVGLMCWILFKKK